MKQLKLNIESLEIQSFSTARDLDEVRGTVKGHDPDTSFAECGGPGGSYQCVSYGEECTWYPELQCYSNAIAYPTEPRCDRNCRLTVSTCIC